MGLIAKLIHIMTKSKFDKRENKDAGTEESISKSVVKPTEDELTKIEIEVETRRELGNANQKLVDLSWSEQIQLMKLRKAARDKMVQEMVEQSKRQK